jgi:hypothetical protein
MSGQLSKKTLSDSGLTISCENMSVCHIFCQDLLHWLDTLIFVLPACLPIFPPLFYYFLCFPIKSASIYMSKETYAKTK